MKPNTHLWNLAGLFLELEIFQTKVVEKIKTDILFSVSFFSKNRAVYEIMLKNIVQPEATDYNMTHAHCMLYT